jgi:hypothetical protein
MYDRWEKGEILFNKWRNEFKTLEEIKEILRENTPEIDSYDADELNELLDYNDWHTLESFWDSVDEYEDIHYTYTTENGEEIIAFGYYGYDG